MQTRWSALVGKVSMDTEESVGHRMHLQVLGGLSSGRRDFRSRDKIYKQAIFH